MLPRLLKYHIQRYEQLPSTNAYAMDLLPQAPKEGTVIWADHQYAGKGQKGNQWTAEPGLNLTFSLIIYPHLPAERIYGLSQVAAIALQQTVQEHLPQVSVQLKWPNDLLINGQKAAGILIENQLEGSKVKASVIGIGLNVQQRSFPPELARRATSLSLWSDQIPTVHELLLELLHRFSKTYTLVEQKAWSSLQAEYLSHLYGHRQDLQVTIDGRRQSAYLCGVEPSGRLVLRLGGQQRSFDVKEVQIALPVD